MTTATSQSERRPTKAERGAATRTRLLDATIDCLVELGWSGTSTTEVVRRAGVSRGAQVHHFPSKEDLVLAAVEHLCARRVEEYRLAFEGLSAGERTPGVGFDLLRSVSSGGTWDAWLELATAARTQPALRERFIEANKRFLDEALEVFQEMFPETAMDPEFARVGLHFSFSVLDGLAMARLCGMEQADVDQVVEAFKTVTAPYFPLSGGATG